MLKWPRCRDLLGFGAKTTGSLAEVCGLRTGPHADPNPQLFCGRGLSAGRTVDSIRSVDADRPRIGTTLVYSLLHHAGLSAV